MEGLLPLLPAGVLFVSGVYALIRLGFIGRFVGHLLLLIAGAAALIPVLLSAVEGKVSVLDLGYTLIAIVLIIIGMHGMGKWFTEGWKSYSTTQ